MDIPQYSTAQYLDASTLNATATTLLGADRSICALTNTPGIINAGSLSWATSGLVVTATLPTSAAVVFGNGTLASAHGTTDGFDTQTYAINLASFVPGSGTATVYLVATAIQIQWSPFTVIGPPVGHPDFDPAFAPYLAYATLRDSLSITGTTTPPDGVTTIEFGRVVLTPGQVTITSVDVSHLVTASSILNSVVAAQAGLPIASVTYGADGRVTGSVAAYGVDIGAVNAVAVTLSPAPASLTAGLQIEVKVAHANTGAASLNVNGLGVAPMVHKDGNPLNAGDLATNGIASLIYTGSAWQLLGSLTTTISPLSSVIPCVVSYGADGRLTSVVSGYGADVGSVNSLVINPSPAATSLVPGMGFDVLVGHTNTGFAYLNVSGLGTGGILNPDNTALVAGQLQAGQLARFVWNASRPCWNLMSITNAYGGLSTNNTWSGVNIFSQEITANAGVVAKADGGGLQFRAVNGNYGIGLLNDGEGGYLVGTNAGVPYGGYNGFRPFAWSLVSGNVAISSSGSPVTIGGFTTVNNGFTVNGNASVSGNLEVNGFVDFTDTVVVAGGITANGGGIVWDNNNIAFTGNYIVLPNGLIFQWGSQLLGTPSITTLTFPIAFPNAGFNVIVSLGASIDLTIPPCVGCDFISNSQFNVAIANTFSGTYGVHWYAIGR